MSWELIVFFAVWLISTEVIYFVWLRGLTEQNSEYHDGEILNFIGDKILSIMTGFIAAIILFGAPAMFTRPDLEIGAVAYAWYYGVGGSILLFFGVNYAIHKWLEKKEK